jgi:YadA-like protein
LPSDLSGSVATLQSQIGTLQNQIKQAFEGTAIAIALGGSTLPGDKKYAVSVNWGNFRGENAMSLSGQLRVTDYVVLNAGFAAGFAQGGVGSRAGVTFAW